MKNKIKFSIIVPVHNAEAYLSECLESLVDQNYENFEVIVINDGSTDKSEDIIERYAMKNPKIKYFTEKHNGANYARGAGVKMANSDYCLFVDADDWVDKDLLKCIGGLLEHKRYNSVRFNGTIDNSRTIKNACLSLKVKQQDLSHDEIKDRLLTGYTMSSLCFQAYKTSTLKRVKSFNYKISNAEDYLINLEYYSCSRGKTIAIADRLYHYRQNTRSTTHNSSRIQKIRNSIDLAFVLYKKNIYAKKWGVSKRGRHAIKVKAFLELRYSVAMIFRPGVRNE